MKTTVSAVLSYSDFKISNAHYHSECDAFDEMYYVSHWPSSFMNVYALAQCSFHGVSVISVWCCAIFIPADTHCKYSLLSSLCSEEH